MTILMRAKILALPTLALFLASGIHAAPLPDDLVGLKVFARYNLIFPGQAPRVYADNIVFIENQEDCGASIWEFVIARGAEVGIVAVEDRGDFFCVTVAAGKFGNRDVLLDKSGNGDYEPAFNRAFSLKKVTEIAVDRCDPQTEAELIGCLGFPIYRCQRDGFTFFYYNEQFSGSRIQGFHDAWFKLQDGKVIDVSGYI